MEEDVYETVLHRNGEVILEAHLPKSEIEEQIRKIVPDFPKPHLLMVRAMLTDGFFPLTPDTALSVKNVHEPAQFKHLETLSV